MVMVILSILLGIAGIAVMTHQAGRESLNLQIRQLIDKTNKNAVGTFKAVIEPTVKSLKYVFSRPVYLRNNETLASCIVVWVLHLTCRYLNVILVLIVLYFSTSLPLSLTLFLCLIDSRFSLLRPPQRTPLSLHPPHTLLNEGTLQRHSHGEKWSAQDRNEQDLS